MKFAYIDESGGEEHTDVFVMSGILVDATKLRKHTAYFDEKLKKMRAQHYKEPDDFKAHKIINGLDGWSNILPDVRKKFITDIVKQVCDIGTVYAFALSFKRWHKAVENHSGLPKNQDNYWVASALYIGALIQKKAQKEKKNKGMAVVIFDDNKMYMPKLSDGLYECNAWYDDLYVLPILTGGEKVEGKTVGRTQEWLPVEPENRFSHIINTAFAIKSQHSSLIQVADIISYIYRRHLELFSLQDSLQEEYTGERELYEGWVSCLEKRRQKIGLVPPDSKVVKFYHAVRHPNWKI